MSFIRKIKRGDSTYLVKVESFRKGDKVRQRVLEYIGKEVNGNPVIKMDINKVNVSSVKRYLDIEILHRLSLELGLPKLLGDYHKPLLAMVYAHIYYRRTASGNYRNGLNTLLYMTRGNAKHFRQRICTNH